MNESLYYDLKETTGLTHSLATQIAREIGRRIVGQSYEPGDLLNGEDELAEKYRVSRSVIRDAVKILVGKGLLYQGLFNLTDFRPVAACDGCDGLRSCDEVVPGLAPRVENRVICVERPVCEPCLAEILPNVFG